MENKPNPIPKLKKFYEFFFVIVAFFNLLLVLFDALYLYKLPYYHGTLRDLLLYYYPNRLKESFDPIALWDPIKGIEPHRFNVEYESNYEELKRLYNELVGSQPQVQKEIEKQIEEIQKKLIDLSIDMIDKKSVESYFFLANKNGVLEKIKNKIKKHLPNEANSAKESFRQFFSKENLNPDRREAELLFFDTEIMPLLRENYFRWIDENGELKDYFYKIDRWFVLFFIFDFFLRWFLNRKKYKKWYQFPIHHFYEIFNLYPPHYSALWRLLRVIPFYIRLKENHFIPDEGIFPEVIHNNAKLIADEISGLVLINIIEQTIQQLKEEGRLELEPKTFDSLEVLLNKQMEIFSNQIMPEIEPLITEMVQYSINRAAEPFLLSPIGPIVRILLYNIHATVRDGLEAAFSGPEGLERLRNILQKSTKEMLKHLSNPEVQDLTKKDLIQFLEILKIDIANNFQ
ncbi:MAG: hypothetical protein ACK4UJ_08290 [Leptonema sp. (in: bacteria)]